jgi:hypothetical protein
MYFILTTYYAHETFHRNVGEYEDFLKEKGYDNYDFIKAFGDLTDGEKE